MICDDYLVEVINNEDFIEYCRKKVDKDSGKYLRCNCQGDKNSCEVTEE